MTTVHHRNHPGPGPDKYPRYSKNTGRQRQDSTEVRKNRSGGRVILYGYATANNLTSASSETYVPPVYSSPPTMRRDLMN